MQHVLVVLLVQYGQLMKQGDGWQVLRHGRQRRYRLGQHVPLLVMTLYGRLFVLHAVHGCCGMTWLFRWLGLAPAVHLQQLYLYYIINHNTRRRQYILYFYDMRRLGYRVIQQSSDVNDWCFDRQYNIIILWMLYMMYRLTTVMPILTVYRTIILLHGIILYYYNEYRYNGLFKSA